MNLLCGLQMNSAWPCQLWQPVLVFIIGARVFGSSVVLKHNNSLQRAFDPPTIFAAAKTVVASNAAELSR
jgi:hypothetical protein